MRNSIKLAALMYVTVAVLLSGCKKDPLMEPELIQEIDSWSKVERVNLNWQYLRSAYVSGDSLFLYGQDYFMIYTPHGDQLTAYMSPYWTPSITNPVLAMNPAMRSDYVIDWYPSGIGIRSIHNLVSAGNCRFVDLQAVDSSISFPWWVNQSTTFELPCVSADNNVFAPMYNDSGYPAAFMFEARINYMWSDHYADTANFRRVNFIEPAFWGYNVAEVWSYDNRFFVNVGNYFTSNNFTISVEANGSWSYTGIPSPCRFSDIVQTGDSLVAVCGITPRIYISTDGGINWLPRYSVPSSWLSLQYVVLNGTIYAFTQDEIYRLRMNQNDVILTELNNEGLEGNLITDIVLFEDSVYITTLSGLYVKPLSDFNNEHP